MHGYSYESGRYPPAERGKLLIGIIAVALVLVVVGIVAAVMGQKEAAPTVAAGSTEATEPGSSEPGSTEPGTTTEPEATEPEATEPGATEPGATEPGATEPGATEPGATEPGATEPGATEPGAAEDVETQPEPMLVASLIAGNTTMPASTWGTDESFLSGVPDLPTTPDPVVEPEVVPIDPVVDEKPATKQPVKNVVKRPNTNKRPRVNNVDDDDDVDDVDEDDDDDDGARSPRPSGKSANAATAEAKGLYRRRKFDDAADILDQAADRVDDKLAEELLDLATSYKQVGQLLASAEKSTSSDPGAALASYKRALSKDKRVGGGAHAKLIRLRIGQVAPKAAKSFMAKGRLSDAKKAADDAARYQEGAAVKAVYDSLERKADSLIKKALAAKRKGDDDKAKDLLRDATKIAPKDTEAWEQSRKELKRF